MLGCRFYLNLFDQMNSIQFELSQNSLKTSRIDINVANATTVC